MVVCQKALVGKLKRFSVGTQEIFAMSTSYLDKQGLFFNLYKSQNHQRSEEDKNEGSQHVVSQTYPQWKVMLDFHKLHSFRKRKQFKKRKMYILPMRTSRDETTMKVGEQQYDNVNSWLSNTVAEFASLFFAGMNVEFLDFLNIEQLGFKTRIHSRTNEEQVLVGDILDYLKKMKPKDCFCIVGWSWLDLYPSPDLNFVLGEACFDSGCAVISFGRYSDVQPNLSFDNLQHENEGSFLCEDLAQLQSSSPKKASEPFTHLSGRKHNRMTLEYGVVWRVIKVFTHEICHLLGMHHCTFFACLMNESNNVCEAEEQPLFLCPICLRKLQKFLKFSVLTRYQAVKDYIEHRILGVFNNTPCTSQDSLGLGESAVVRDAVFKKEIDRPRHSNNLRNPLNNSPTTLHKFEDCATWLRNICIYINNCG